MPLGKTLKSARVVAAPLARAAEGMVGQTSTPDWVGLSKVGAYQGKERSTGLVPCSVAVPADSNGLARQFATREKLGVWLA